MRTCHAITTCSLSFFIILFVGLNLCRLQLTRRRPRTRLLSGGVRRRQWVWAKEGKKRRHSRCRWKKPCVRNSDAMAAGPSRIRSRLTQSRAIRRRAADRACHVGPSRSSLEASQCPLETMKLSNYLWSHPKGCSEAVHALATKSVTLKEHGPPTCFTQADDALASF